MTRRRVRQSLVPLLALGCLAAAGIATANWTSGGQGGGAGGTGTTVAVTLSPGSTSGDLFPGGVGDVELEVTNPNASQLTISTLALDSGLGQGGYAVDAAHLACGLSTFDFTTQTNGGSGWVVPGRAAGVDGALSITLSNALTMGSTADDACQGALVTVYLVGS